MDTKRAMLRFISLMLCLMLVLSGVGVRTLAEGTALPQAQETQDPADDGEDGTEGNVTDGEGTAGDETDGEGTDGDGTDGEGADGEETGGDGNEGDGTDGEGTDGEGTDGEGTEGEGADGDGTEGGETDGEGTGAEGSEGDGAEGDEIEGNGNDGEGAEGDGTDGEGTEGDGNGTEGDGTEGEGIDGNGTDGEGSEGDITGGEGTDGDGIEGDGTDGEGADGEGAEGDGTDGEGTDGDITGVEGTDGEGTEGDGEGIEGDDTDGEGADDDGIDGEGADGEDGEEPEPEIVFATGPVSESLAPIGGADNDVLFEQYIRRNLPGLGGGVKLRSASPSAVSQLNENTQKLCNALIPKLEAVANGSITDTKFVLKVADLGLEKYRYSVEELGIDPDTVYDPQTHSFISTDGLASALMSTINFQFDLLIKALLADCPYTLYWYDKTVGTPYGYSYSYGVSNGQPWVSLGEEITYQFPVSKDYRPEGSDQYTVDPAYPSRVQNAGRNIQTILATHASEGDYTKLDNYKTEICNLVEYNHNAADDNNNVAYGDPWQLVFVFDGDSTTNVVCEGYSKAFKYLCDRSAFTGGTRCITVSGIMQSGNTSGGHMWNIVYMPDDRYYLVDITNCDGNSIGSPDKLFLKGWASHPSDAVYVFNCTGSNVYYTYYGYMSELFGTAWLTLSQTDFDPNKTYYSITVPAFENGTVTPSREKAAADDPVTLTVQAAEGYELVEGSLTVTGPGESAVTLTPNADGTYSFTMPAGNVTVNAAFAKPVPTFANHSVVLKGLIGVDFYMDLPNGASAYPGSYMSFAGNNGKIDATANTPSSPDSDGQYKYTCYVSSIQMAEKITPTFHYTQGGQEFTVQGEPFSAEDYIIWASNNLSGTNLEIVKALADYGYYAQQYLSVQNDWTIGTDYAAMTTHFTEPSGFNRETILAGAAESAFTATENSQTVAQSGYRLNLGSTISLDVRMLPAEGTEITSVTLDGAAAAVTVSGQYSVVTKSGIMASGLADEYIIVTGDCTIHVSAMSYVYEMLGRDNSSAAFKNLLCALYEYAKACK